MQRFPYTHCLCLLLCISCSTEEGAQHRSPSSSFESLLDEYSDVVSEMPGDPRTDEVLSMLRTAALEEDWARSDSIDGSIMLRVPNHRLALILLDKRLAGEKAERASRVQEYVALFRSQAPGTSVEAKAVSYELDRLLRDSPVDFLARCDKILLEDPTSKIGRVALHKRLVYYETSDQSKRAALDALQFLALHPNRVSALGGVQSFASRLTVAGFLLEASALIGSDDSAALASAIYSELTSASVEHPESRASLSSAYYKHAPDVVALGRAALESASIEERAVFLLRFGRIAAEQADRASAIYAFRAYLEVLKQRLQEPPSTADFDRMLRSFHHTALQFLGQLYMYEEDRSRAATRRPLGAMNDGRRLISELSWHGMLLFSEDAGGSGTAVPSERLLTEHVALLTKIGNHQGVIEAYQWHFNSYPNSHATPKLMLQLAQHYEEHLRASSSARAVLDEIVERFPTSPHAVTAVLQKSLSLMEEKSYDDAYVALQEFMVTYQEDSRFATALFMAAVCEAVIGMDELAVAHMTDIVDNFRKSDDAARALDWLGRYYLSRLEYDRAYDSLVSLIERYPDSTYAHDARRTVETLGQSLASQG